MIRGGADRAALQCLMAVGAILLLFPCGAIAAVSTKPAVPALHTPAAAQRHPKLLQPIGTRRAAPLGGQRRPGKTITVRTSRAVNRSLPR